MVEQGIWGTEVSLRGPGARMWWESGGEAPEAIGTMKYCAYKNWFLCIICLYVIAKTCTEIEKTYSICNQTGSDGYFRDDVPC